MPHDEPQSPSPAWTRKSFLRGMAAVGVAPLLPGVLPSPARAASSEGAGGFPLLRDGVVVDLFVDPADDPAVARTRKHAQMLDTLYKTAIVLITENYVDEKADLAAFSPPADDTSLIVIKRQ